MRALPHDTRVERAVDEYDLADFLGFFLTEQVASARSEFVAPLPYTLSSTMTDCSEAQIIAVIKRLGMNDELTQARYPPCRR